MPRPEPFGCLSEPFCEPRRVVYDTQPQICGSYQSCMQHCHRIDRKYQDPESTQVCAQFCHLKDASDPYAFLNHLSRNQ